MSTTQSATRPLDATDTTSSSTESDRTDERRVSGPATATHLQVFFEVIESDPHICQNCFARRELEARHFRSSGGRATGSALLDDLTADRFCEECCAGTGKASLHRPHEGYWDAEAEEATSDSGLLVDYSNVHCELGRRFIRDMGGTIEREWGGQRPLPKNGEQISFFRLLRNLRDRLREKHYPVPWTRWKEIGNDLKDHYPSEDRGIFARLVVTSIPTDN